MRQYLSPSPIVLFVPLSIYVFSKNGCIACTWVCICIHTYIHSYIQACMHTYIHSCIHTYMNTYIQECMHGYIRMHVNTHIYRHCKDGTDTCTHRERERPTLCVFTTSSDDHVSGSCRSKVYLPWCEMRKSVTWQLSPPLSEHLCVTSSFFT